MPECGKTFCDRQILSPIALYTVLSRRSIWISIAVLYFSGQRGALVEDVCSCILYDVLIQFNLYFLTGNVNAVTFMPLGHCGPLGCSWVCVFFHNGSRILYILGGELTLAKWNSFVIPWLSDPALFSKTFWISWVVTGSRNDSFFISVSCFPFSPRHVSIPLRSCRT